MQFRQKLPVVEAVQWFPVEHVKHVEIPEVSDEFPEYTAPDGSFWHAYAIIRRDGGHLTLSPGDWLTKDNQGNMRVVPAAVFHQLYESA